MAGPGGAGPAGRGGTRGGRCGRGRRRGQRATPPPAGPAARRLRRRSAEYAGRPGPRRAGRRVRPRRSRSHRGVADLGEAPIEPDGDGRRILAAVWRPKGGPGRTTVAVNLAFEAAAASGEVLLVDADTYGGAVAHANTQEHHRYPGRRERTRTGKTTLLIHRMASDPELLCARDRKAPVGSAPRSCHAAADQPIRCCSHGRAIYKATQEQPE